MQENYHSGDIIFSLFDYRGEEMSKRVYIWWQNHVNCLTIMAANSKINRDYYYFYLMKIHASCEMLAHIFCNKGKVLRQVVVSIIVLN